MAPKPRNKPKLAQSPTFSPIPSYDMRGRHSSYDNAGRVGSKTDTDTTPGSIGSGLAEEKQKLRADLNEALNFFKEASNFMSEKAYQNTLDAIKLNDIAYNSEASFFERQEKRRKENLEDQRLRDIARDALDKVGGDFSLAGLGGTSGRGIILSNLNSNPLPTSQLEEVQAAIQRGMQNEAIREAVRQNQIQFDLNRRLAEQELADRVQDRWHKQAMQQLERDNARRILNPGLTSSVYVENPDDSISRLLYMLGGW